MGPDLNYLRDRLAAPPDQMGRIPNTDNVAGLPRDQRRMASDIARYFNENLEAAMVARRPHAMTWTKVLSIMSDIHYFKMTPDGTWIPLRRRDDRQIRARVPLMDSYYRWEHGRLSTNKIGVTATPTTGRGALSFAEAELAESIISHWLDEVQIQAIDEEANQHLLVYGGYALSAEKCLFRQQVDPVLYPFCDLFPIPFDAKTWREMSGVQRSILVSDAWLEKEDELFERRYNRPPDQPMARLARNVGTKPTASFTGFSSGLQWGSAFKGARASWIYMRPTELNPFGEHIFMIDDKVFGYVSGQDTNGRKLALHHGELPLYPVYYTKKPHDWWPHGFCGNLVAPQREVNRQVTAILESAIINRGLLGYNTDLVSKDDILNAPSGLVPFRSPGYEDRGSPPLIGVSTTQVSRDVGAVLSIFQDAAKQAAGYESGIIVGQSEGRVEGGPATSILNTNAQAPLQPVLDRKRMAYGRLFQDALGLIREVWPPEKRIRVIGPQNLGRELLVLRDKIPNADEVVLTPTPMVANGRGGMFNMLLALRTQPTENGEPPIVRTYEVRRALHLLDLAPPGLDLFDEAERRILWRIGNLINDGQAPAIAPAGSSPLDMQAMENHVLAVDLLKRAILHPSFMLYSPDVQRALRMELEFHSGRLPGMAAGMVDSFDDPMLRTETRQAEDALEAMENDPTSLAGLFAPGGVI